MSKWESLLLCKKDHISKVKFYVYLGLFVNEKKISPFLLASV